MVGAPSLFSPHLSRERIVCQRSLLTLNSRCWLRRCWTLSRRGLMQRRVQRLPHKGLHHPRLTSKLPTDRRRLHCCGMELSQLRRMLHTELARQLNQRSRHRPRRRGIQHWIASTQPIDKRASKHSRTSRRRIHQGCCKSVWIVSDLRRSL